MNAKFLLIALISVICIILMDTWWNERYTPPGFLRQQDQELDAYDSWAINNWVVDYLRLTADDQDEPYEDEQNEDEPNEDYRARPLIEDEANEDDDQ